eukprot:scaffold138134_cov160-Phaeocystis_antarctica.AAC.1
MDGKIYVSGGCFENAHAQGSGSSTVTVFDPQANTWTKVASMGRVRKYHSSAAIRGKLYVFGGFSDGAERTASVEAYDPTSNTWAQASELTCALDS